MKKIKNYLILGFFTVFSFVGGVRAEYTKVSCGNIKNIPKKIPELTTWAVTLIEVAIPIILVILSMVDLIKAVSSQKEDEIKKGKNVLVKRLILAAIIFLFVALIKFVISIVANSTDTNNISKCISCFIENVDNCKKN